MQQLGLAATAAWAAAATPAIAALARSEAIYKDVKFSDHAPITIGYDMTL